MLRALALTALLLLAAAPLIAPASGSAPPASFVAGFGIRDISPSGPVDLGGFGFGCCRVSQGTEYPVHVRAMVVGDGVTNVALASVEVQGSFAAYQNGAFGQYDIAKAVEAATGGALPRDHIIVSSDHSHRGADTTGVWGGMPDAEMYRIANATRGAILDAFAARAPALVRVAEINASSYVTSDFSSPRQDTPDGAFRLLFIESAPGTVAGVYGTFSAHATLHGSPPYNSPDWPGIVSDAVGARFGGVHCSSCGQAGAGAPGGVHCSSCGQAGAGAPGGVHCSSCGQAGAGASGGVQVVLGEGAVGRTHPNGDRSTWEDRITNDIYAAYGASSYVTAMGVAGAESAITLTAYNALLLTGLTIGHAGCDAPANPVSDALRSAPANPTCYPISRSTAAPWLVGNRLTTLVSAVRIGDVLVWGAPGEIYPNAQWWVQGHVSAPHVFVAGLANDQLGYLISPAEDWPKIASTPTSDNTLFNVDVTGGDHVACAAADLAGQLGFETTSDTRCAPWSLEDRTLPP